ncbi:MAG: hypothetical protein ABIH34_07705 [Nanoarchaeota archaeon]
MKQLLKVLVAFVVLFLVLASFFTLFSVTDRKMHAIVSILSYIFLAGAIVFLIGELRRSRWSISYTRLLLALSLFYFIYLYLTFDSPFLLAVIIVNVVGFLMSLRVSSIRKQTPKVEVITRPLPASTPRTAKKAAGQKKSRKVTS